MPEPERVEGPANPAAAARREMAAAKAMRPRRGVRQALIDFYGWLDGHQGTFRPLLLACVAAAVGLLVAPDLRLRAYPIDAELVGTPVTENIKAPYDLEVVDEETTTRLRGDAVAQVRPVFDFDAEAALRLKERVVRAFRLARERLEEENEAEPVARPVQGRRGARPAAASARQEGPTRAPDAPDSAPPARFRARFEQALGTAVSEPSWQQLWRSRFVPEVEAALVSLATHAAMDPVVASAEALAPFRDTGIALQRVPALHPSARLNGGAGKSTAPSHQVVHDIATLADVEAARVALAVQAAQLFVPEGALMRSPELRRQAPELAEALACVAQALVEPNVSFNRAETEQARAQARESVKPVSVAIKKGEMIIRDGERLTERHLMLLRGLGEDGQKGGLALVGIGGVVLLVLLCALSDKLTDFLRRDKAILHARDLLFLASLFLLSLCACRSLLFVGRGLAELWRAAPREAWAFCLPVAFAAMVVRLVLNAELALMFCVLHSLTLGLLADGDRLLSLYALCGSVAAVGAIGTISARGDLLRAGAWAGLTQLVAALGIMLYSGTTEISSYLWAMPAAMSAGILASVLAFSVTPAVEWAFDYTTDLKLLELANLNHPALKELIVQAPGSYHHSIIVGALVEAAAESIGANPLLARVMAYYHDLGKGCNPGYFIENQRGGHNPHDKLKPSMSAMVIRRHVTDGIELAKRHGLGEQILAGIAQHHGNTLIHFFYHKAREQAPPGETVSEADYRYPGTKPQTREAALVMLGDSIEAASRAMADPNGARLQGLTQRIINSKFTDGQLEECDLTLRDLHTIAKSFSLVLTSIYHHRLEYPDAGHEGKKSGTRGDPDSKHAQRAEADDASAAQPAKHDLRRLGL